MADKMKYGELFEKLAKNAETTPENIRELKKQMGLELRESLKKVAAKDKKRHWVNQGVAHFSDILRQNFVKNYLDANRNIIV